MIVLLGCLMGSRWRECWDPRSHQPWQQPMNLSGKSDGYEATVVKVLASPACTVHGAARPCILYSDSFRLALSRGLLYTRRNPQACWLAQLPKACGDRRMPVHVKSA